MDYYDQIEEYLNNALSEGDKIAFEIALTNDAKLKQAVDDHGVAMDVVGSILEGEVRKVIGEEEIINNEQLIIDNGGEENESGNENGKLKIENGNLSNEEQKGKKGAKVRKMKWMRWGAAAVVVFVLGWWGMDVRQSIEYSKRHEIVMVTYSKTKPSNSGSRGGEETKDLAESAIKAFDLNDRVEAKKLFLQLEEIQESENLAKRYLGHIYFIRSKYKKSIAYFKQIKMAGYEVEEANQMLVYNYYILGKISEMEKLLVKNPGLYLPGND